MPSSAYLPPDFDPSANLAIVAGRGRYPFISATRAAKQGVPLHLVALGGETDPQLREAAPWVSTTEIKVGQIGALIRHLKAIEAASVLMVGQVTPGKLFRGLHPDLKAVRILAGLRERNAHSLFGAVVAEIESAGATVLDARSFLDGDLVQPGPLNRGKLRLPAEEIDFGIQKARQLSELDIGQGLVVNKGTVLAVEGFDGTDAMLRRCREFDSNHKLFVKVAKPGHDFRFDVPVVGPRTIESLAEGGVTFAGLEAGRTLLLDRESLLAEADRRRIHLFGF